MKALQENDPRPSAPAGAPPRGRRAFRARRRWLLLLALTLIPLPPRLLLAAAAGPGVGTPALATQQLRRRKSLHEVERSPEELKNLRHAFFMIKKKAKTCNDPDAANDYDCWAAYHNNFDLYGCRHFIDLFWPWHRYHLVEFEKALRNSDPEHPERVRDVTLPYWDWTAAPTGVNFPKSVEQENLNPGEYYPEDCPDPAQPCKNPLWNEQRRPNAQPCPRVQPACISDAVGLAEWRDFGGGTSAGQISDFELQAHNFMHASYIRGPMANPLTAARDPIYWFFHTYIDKVWDDWQRFHQAEDPCSPTNVPIPQRRLRIGEWPPSNVTFASVLCASQLGYEYAPAPPFVAALPNCPPANSGCNTAGPETPVALQLSLPAGRIEKAELSLAGVSIPTDFSYNARVLLHPAAVKYRPGDSSFTEQYGATYFVAWRSHHAHGAHGGAAAHPTTMDLQLDVTKRLSELAGRPGVKGLVATIVFSPSDSAERSSPLVFDRDVSFSKATLIVRRPLSSRERHIPLSIRR